MFIQRRRFKQSESLENRLIDEAQRLREQARGTPPGIERERLIRKARQAVTALQISEWVRSPGLQAPR